MPDEYVLTEQNNKILKTITDVYVDFSFSITDHSLVADKEYSEVYDAIESGKRVVFTQQGKFFGYAFLYNSKISAVTAVKVNITGNAGTPVSGRLPEIDMITYWGTGTIETYNCVLNPSPFVVVFSGTDEDHTSACDTLWDAVNENKQNAVFMYDSGEVTYKLMSHYDGTHVWANSAISPDTWIYCSIESNGTVSCVIEKI
jgi:hypothetical protein